MTAIPAVTHYSMSCFLMIILRTKDWNCLVENQSARGVHHFKFVPIVGAARRWNAFVQFITVLLCTAAKVSRCGLFPADRCCGSADKDNAFRY
ncbi:hypothetical protein CS542_07125 [Pedobacter sp. IW39]|nr:hypothetical protein CS542_07125 [Pedobacter sp. IW39]